MVDGKEATDHEAQTNVQRSHWHRADRLNKLKVSGKGCRRTGHHSRKGRIRRLFEGPGATLMLGASFLALPVQVDAAEEFGKRVRA